MDAKEIERDIVSKLEKLENNKNVISEVLSENANASGSMNMPRPTQKKIAEVMNIVANLGNNKCNLDHFYSQYKSSAEFVESAEETLKTMEFKLEEMCEMFNRFQNMYNYVNVLSKQTEKLEPKTESENDWLDI